MVEMARDINREEKKAKDRKPNIDAMWFGEKEADEPEDEKSI
jgi:hypothetical protein